MMSPIRRALSVIAIVFSFVLALTAFGEVLTTSWTYQGQLRRSGTAYNGICNFQFSLWSSAIGGVQLLGTQSINGVNVGNGLFTVTLDFGDLGSEALWLGTSVQCGEDGGFTPLYPRQLITAAPFALSLRPGASIYGQQGVGTSLSVLGVTNTSGYSESAAIRGNGSIGLWGSTSRTDGFGVRGSALGPQSAGVFGENSEGAAVQGRNDGAGPAILGENTGTGYAGQFTGPVLVEGSLSVDFSSHQGPGSAMSGFGSNIGVSGYGLSRGVYGSTSGNADSNSAGVFGENSSGAGVWGKSTGAGPAVYGQATSNGYAGRFAGSVLVEGSLFVAGSVSKSGGNFRIDHPLDPANKFLSHSFVESPDMKNIYDGNITTDANGVAIVALPDYFAALNRDYRYQLTVLGQFAQAIVSRKIAGNTFEIRTDKPGVEVSWQVTGIRQDAYAQANPIVVEESKPAEEQGLYLFPAGFGAGEEKQIGRSSRPATAPAAPEPPAARANDQARSQ